MKQFRNMTLAAGVAIFTTGCSDQTASSASDSEYEIAALRDEIVALRSDVTQASSDASQALALAEDIQSTHANDQAEDTAAISDLAGDLAELSGRVAY